MTLQIRLAGCILICSASGFWAYLQSRKMKRALDELELLCEFVSFCEREIGYMSTPFPEICDKFGHEEILLFRRFCEGFGDVPFHLSAENEKTVRAFFLNIGGTFREDSLKLCRYTQDILKASLERAREEYPKEAKSEISLALLVGAGVSVILL